MHYHINWSTAGYDWERFDSCEEATKAASILVKPEERFTVERFDHKCVVCEKLKSIAHLPSRLAGEPDHDRQK
jgi:hypothetical protein